MKLRVMGENVEAKLYTKGEMGDGKYSGRALLIQGKIKIWKDMSKQVQEVNLLHELIHYADEKMVIGLKEVEVMQLSNFIYALINDNPEIFKFTPKLEE